eukprot:g16486.t1
MATVFAAHGEDTGEDDEPPDPGADDESAGEIPDAPSSTLEEKQVGELPEPAAGESEEDAKAHMADALDAMTPTEDELPQPDDPAELALAAVSDGDGNEGPDELNDNTNAAEAAFEDFTSGRMPGDVTRNAILDGMAKMDSQQSLSDIGIQSDHQENEAAQELADSGLAELLEDEEAKTTVQKLRENHGFRAEEEDLDDGDEEVEKKGTASTSHVAAAARFPLYHYPFDRCDVAQYRFFAHHGHFPAFPNAVTLHLEWVALLAVNPLENTFRARFNLTVDWFDPAFRNVKPEYFDEFVYVNTRPTLFFANCVELTEAAFEPVLKLDADEELECMPDAGGAPFSCVSGLELEREPEVASPGGRLVPVSTDDVTVGGVGGASHESEDQHDSRIPDQDTGDAPARRPRTRNRRPLEKTMYRRDGPKDPVGTMRRSGFFTGTFSASFQLKEFPCDVQSLTIQIRMWGAGVRANPDYGKYFVMKRNKVNTKLMAESLIDEWNLHEPAAQNFGGIGSKQKFESTLIISRKHQHFTRSVLAPLFGLTSCAFTSFALEQGAGGGGGAGGEEAESNLDARLGIVFTMLLTIVAFKLVVGDKLPRLAYATKVDFYAE